MGKTSKFLFDTYEESIRAAKENPMAVLAVDHDIACKYGPQVGLIMGTFKMGSPVYKERFLQLFNKKTINRIFKKAQQHGLIKKADLSPQEIASILQSKNLHGHGLGHFICQWCGINTLLLHDHHWPIKRLKGGKETVALCGTCHYEYHRLEKGSWVLNEPLYDLEALEKDVNSRKHILTGHSGDHLDG